MKAQAQTTAKKVVTKTATKNEIVKALNAKVQAPKKSLFERQNELKNKAEKSTFDFVKLANVTDKIEDKSISKVYAKVTANAYASQIVGTDKMPTFKEFCEKMPTKPFFSNWDGYKCLAKFNTKNELAKKVSRQNAATAKK